jgi:hypothetical protein
MAQSNQALARMALGLPATGNISAAAKPFHMELVRLLDGFNEVSGIATLVLGLQTRARTASGSNGCLWGNRGCCVRLGTLCSLLPTSVAAAFACGVASQPDENTITDALGSIEFKNNMLYIEGKEKTTEQLAALVTAALATSDEAEEPVPIGSQ